MNSEDIGYPMPNGLLMFLEDGFIPVVRHVVDGELCDAPKEAVHEAWLAIIDSDEEEYLAKYFLPPKYWAHSETPETYPNFKRRHDVQTSEVFAWISTDDDPIPFLLTKTPNGWRTATAKECQLVPPLYNYPQLL